MYVTSTPTVDSHIRRIFFLAGKPHEHAVNYSTAFTELKDHGVYYSEY